MDIVARIVETGKLLRGRPAEEVRRAQLAAMHEATQLATRRVKDRTPQGVAGASGGLLASIQPEVRQSKARVVGIVGTASAYALVVEKGRRPRKGMPPPGVMLRWIEVKLGITGEEAEGVELAIRRKIAARGTKGAFMFEKTLEEDWPQIQSIFERHGVSLARSLER